jgi:ATP-dependent RNA circularization protein (DNA/RNA ligase family)
MQWHTIVGAVIGVLGFFISLFSLWYKIDRDTNAKIDAMGKQFAAQLAEAIKQGDEKRARIYERLDSVKTAHRGEIDNLRKEVVDTFVSSKWCAMIHENADKVYADFKKALSDLNQKVDTLLSRG